MLNRYRGPAARPGLMLLASALALALLTGCGGSKKNATATATGTPTVAVRLASPTPATASPTPATPAATPRPATAPASATARPLSPTARPSSTLVIPSPPPPPTLPPGAATAPPRPATTAPAQLDRCHTSQLTPSFVNANGAAGHSFQTVHLTNHSQAPCTLFGFVGMLMQDAQGRPLPTNVVRNGGMLSNQAAPAQFVLPPRAAASFLIEWTDVLTGNETRCPAASQLEITPPDETDYLLLPLSRAGLAPCGGGTINVAPVRPP